MELYQHASEYKVMEEEIKLADLKRRGRQGAREEQVTIAKEDFNREGTLTIANDFKNMNEQLGIKSPKELAEIVQRAQTGQLKIDPETAQRIGEGIVAQRTAFLNKMRERHLAAYPNMSVKDREDALKEMAAPYDEVLKAVYD